MPDEAGKKGKLSRKVDGHQFDGSENSSPIVRFSIKKRKIIVFVSQSIDKRENFHKTREKGKGKAEKIIVKEEMKRILEKISLASKKTFNSDLRNVYYSAKKVIFANSRRCFFLRGENINRFLTRRTPGIRKGYDIAAHFHFLIAFRREFCVRHMRFRSRCRSYELELIMEN